jgi:hypothetical protein
VEITIGKRKKQNRMKTRIFWFLIGLLIPAIWILWSASSFVYIMEAMRDDGKLVFVSYLADGGGNGLLLGKTLRTPYIKFFLRCDHKFSVNSDMRKNDKDILLKFKEENCKPASVFPTISIAERNIGDTIIQVWSFFKDDEGERGSPFNEDLSFRPLTRSVIYDF